MRVYLTLLCWCVSTLQVPTEEEVTSFLEKCCEVARSMVETRLAATRSAAALSLGIDEYDLDKKFARNCVEERITTLQDKVRLANQQMQGIQGEQTLLHFTLSQLRGQKSNKTALSKDQQVELLLSARRIIQKIMPAPARPASGSVKDTCIDADTLMLQVRPRLSACMREHDLSLKHHSILDCLVCVSASGH